MKFGDEFLSKRELHIFKPKKAQKRLERTAGKNWKINSTPMSKKSHKQAKAGGRKSLMHNEFRVLHLRPLGQLSLCYIMTAAVRSLALQ